MKTQKFETLKKQVMYDSLFAVKSNATAKKTVKNIMTIEKVNSTNKVETIVSHVLNEFKPVLSQLPKSIRGNCIKCFCNAVRRVLADNGTAFCYDNYGNIIAQRIIGKFTAKYESELLQLLCNLLQDSAAEADNKAAEAEAEAKTKQFNDNFAELLAELQNVAA